MPTRPNTLLESSGLGDGAGVVNLTGEPQCRLTRTVAERRGVMQDMARGRLCGCGRSLTQPNC